MNELDKTLVMRNSALVVRPQNNQLRLMVAPATQRWAMMSRAIKMQNRGLLVIEDSKSRWNENAQRWELRVRPVKPAPRRRPWIWIVAVLGALLLLAGLGWWFLMALSTATLGLFLGAVMVAFAALVVRAARRPEITVTTTTTVNIRR